jgi:hypothetical protein
LFGMAWKRSVLKFCKKNLKKLIAISLLLIHLFSTERQLMFYEYLAYQSDKLFDEQIDQNHYNVNDLTEISIPANLPNITDWKDYISLRGRVQFGEAAYNYVKIKMTRTAIYLVCIPNYATTHLSDQNIINARQIPDMPVPKKNHLPVGKISLTTYNHQNTAYRFSTPIAPVSKTVILIKIFLPDACIAGPGQPPDMTSVFS